LNHFLKGYSLSVPPEARRAQMNRLDGGKADAWSLGVLGLVLLTADSHLMESQDLYVYLGVDSVTHGVLLKVLNNKSSSSSSSSGSSSSCDSSSSSNSSSMTLPQEHVNALLDLLVGLLDRNPSSRLMVKDVTHTLASIA